jgi:hypothetical protein
LDELIYGQKYQFIKINNTKKSHKCIKIHDNL